MIIQQDVALYQLTKARKEIAMRYSVELVYDDESSNVLCSIEDNSIQGAARQIGLNGEPAEGTLGSYYDLPRAKMFLDLGVDHVRLNELPEAKSPEEFIEMSFSLLGAPNEYFDGL